MHMVHVREIGIEALILRDRFNGSRKQPIEGTSYMAIERRLILFIVTILMLIMVLIGLDLRSDLDKGAGLAHWVAELVIMAIAGVGLLMLVLFSWSQRAQLKARSARVANLERDLALTRSELASVSKTFVAALERQMLDWQMTVSEQEITLMLLKGLSFIEIAELRQTKEKTVRQQASIIYAKAGVGGRHELSAWFLMALLP